MRFLEFMRYVVAGTLTTVAGGLILGQLRPEKTPDAIPVIIPVQPEDKEKPKPKRPRIWPRTMTGD